MFTYCNFNSIGQFMNLNTGKYSIKWAVIRGDCHQTPPPKNKQTNKNPIMSFVNHGMCRRKTAYISALKKAQKIA